MAEFLTMSRHANRVDEVLGFKAPKWVDEIMYRHNIDRQKDERDVIELVLKQEARRYYDHLLNDISHARDMARAFGLTVMEADLMAMERTLRTGFAFDHRAFYQHMRDPRGT